MLFQLVGFMNVSAISISFLVSVWSASLPQGTLYYTRGRQGHNGNILVLAFSASKDNDKIHSSFFFVLTHQHLPGMLLPIDDPFPSHSLVDSGQQSMQLGLINFLYQL